MTARLTCRWCDNPAKCKGLCSACYSWWRRICHLSHQKLQAYTAKYERMETRMGHWRDLP